MRRRGRRHRRESVASLVSIADGTTSLYFSNGGGIIGAGQHQKVRDASARLIALVDILYPNGTGDIVSKRRRRMGIGNAADPLKLLGRTRIARAFTVSYGVRSPVGLDVREPPFSRSEEPIRQRLLSCGGHPCREVLTMMKSHTITGGGGVQLHVMEAGNPGGRPIVFLHAASQCRLQWSRQMESKLVENHRLVALDMRGHGLSERPREGYDDSRQWADDVHAVIKSLDLDHPVLSRWSCGPLLILDYIRHYGEDGLSGPLRLCFSGELSATDLYLMLGYNISVPRYVRQGLFSRSFDNDDILPMIRKPVLITHGAADAIVKRAAVDQHKAAMPHAQVQLVANAGHAVFWDDAAAFNDRLGAFCESL